MRKARRYRSRPRVDERACKIHTTKMSKKRDRTGMVTRAHAVGSAAKECPICFGDMDSRTEVHPFVCASHGICASCDRRMFRGHDDRCPICRAGRSEQSIANSGARAPGLPVHLRRPDSSVDGRLVFERVSLGGPNDPGGLGGLDDAEAAYISFISRPGNPNRVFSSLAEMFGATNGPRPGRAGISRARTREAARTARYSESLSAAMNLISTDPGFNEALEGLRDPVSVPLATFLARIRGNSVTINTVSAANPFETGGV